jgi:Domain of unknown function (DUF222)
LIGRIDAVHRRISDAQRELFSLIAEVDGCEAWRGTGARDMAHWLSMRYGISHWKAQRWIAAAHALPDLPRISEAFASGVLGIDKVVELTRFATPETEAACSSGLAACRAERSDGRATWRLVRLSTRSWKSIGADRSPGGTSTKGVGSGSRPSCRRRRVR